MPALQRGIMREREAGTGMRTAKTCSHCLLPVSLMSVALLFSLGSASEEVKPTTIEPGHSEHGEVYNEGPRQTAFLMEGIPKVHFSITAKIPEAQQFFDQGVGQLHGYWYLEAERSFRKTAALEPACAMAYWGMAMANPKNAARAREFIKKASELKSNASPREVLWIDSLANYYKDEKKDEKTRRRDLIRGLEGIVQDFPDDLEAKAFLVFEIVDNGDKLPINSRQAVDALAAQVLAVNPMHPIHHYRIHLWDEEKAVRALDSAALCGQTSPGIAHMWHMPGHIFSDLNRYADAAWQQEAALRVDNAYTIRDRVMPDQIFNYAHNAEWLIRDLGNTGRIHYGIELAKNLIEMPRHPKYNLLSNSATTAALGRKRLLDILIRFEMWDELIRLGDGPYLEPTESVDDQIKRLHALGTAYFGKSDLENGAKQIAFLEGILQKERDAQKSAGEKAEAKARAEKQSNDKAAKAKNDAIKEFSKRLDELDIAIAELDLYRQLQQGEYPAARENFLKLKNLSKERQIAIYMQFGDKTKAEQLARENADATKNQVGPLAIHAGILSRCGKSEAASEVFKRLRPFSAEIDLDIPVFQRLLPIAQAEKLPADWRLPAPKPTDVGKHPSLDDLGPFRWHATLAPDWTLPGADGKLVNLRDYRGKPVVLLFYLGYGCPHCVEQLNLFAPMQKEFADAGISLLGLGTDSPDVLHKAFTAGAFPFPLVSDKGMNIFKLYRVFDDFENKPLHGTFLVDTDGMLRWQDISFEPFKDPKFLLEEAKRLLKLPGR